MFPSILTEAQQTVLELLSRIPEIGTFYLAGDTGLALCLGHRRSEDFDFFRADEVIPLDLLTVLRHTGELAVLHEAAGTRSLTFFDDAEAEAMPDLLIGVTWTEIKAFFAAEATRLFRSL